MKYKREAALRNGKMLVLRSLTPEDAQQAISVMKKTAGETLHMMRYADEVTVSLEKEREVLAQTEYGSTALMLGAFADGRLVGIGNFRPAHPADRARHRAGVGICVLKSHWGLGIGTALMHAMIAAAKTTALEQLELDVVSTNAAAIRLYERCGFEAYGRHPRLMKYRDGTYADAILMMLDLSKKQ